MCVGFFFLIIVVIVIVVVTIVNNIIFHALELLCELLTIAPVLWLAILAKSPTIQHPTNGRFLCGVVGEGNLAWKAKCCFNRKRKQNLYLLMALRIIPVTKLQTPLYVYTTCV